MREVVHRIDAPFIARAVVRNVRDSVNYGARLNITNTLMSKRYLKKLVEEGFVRGWDDPRMPTIMGLKNRGVPPVALKKFCADVGVAKAVALGREGARFGQSAAGCGNFFRR